MKYLKYLILINFISCSQNMILYNNENFVIKGKIPKGFSKEIIMGIHEVDYLFRYPNSATLYMTNQKGTPSINYNNINTNTDNIQRSFLAFIENDTLTLKGCNNGLFWKNIKLKKGNIGYFNVTKNDILKFDKTLNKLIVK